MRSSFRASLTMFVASFFAVAAVAGAAAQADNSPRMHGMQHWAVDHEALLNAKLAALKAGLGLNADQEKLWGPFEAAVRDAAQLRMQRMKERMEMMRGGTEPDMGEDEHEGEPGSPVDRLEALADRLSEAGTAIKKVADAAKPLYASLDDTQKRVFVMLSRDMMMLGHEHGDMMERGGMMEWGRGHPGWGPHHRYDEQKPADSQERYLPPLNLLMVATQLSHFKLWYAGVVQNWPLANYELTQIRASIDRAQRLYPNNTKSNMTTMTPAAVELENAIKAKDGVKFSNAYSKLTAECTSCHEATGFGFIKMREPKLSPIETSPFSDELFSGH